MKTCIKVVGLLFLFGCNPPTYSEVQEKERSPFIEILPTCDNDIARDETGFHLVDCCDEEPMIVGTAPIMDDEEFFFWDEKNCGECGNSCGCYENCVCRWVKYSSGVLLDCGCEE